MIVNHLHDIDLYAAGFYRIDDFNNLLYAPNAIFAPDYTMRKEDRHTYTYPHNGWMWFDCYADAVEHWNIEEPPAAEQTVNTILEGLDEAHIAALRQALGL